MAWIGKKDPPKGKVGFMYMLEGGTDASNTDPYAAGPGRGQQLDQDRAACDGGERHGDDGGLPGKSRRPTPASPM